MKEKRRKSIAKKIEIIYTRNRKQNREKTKVRERRTKGGKDVNENARTIARVERERARALQF